LNFERQSIFHIKSNRDKVRRYVQAYIMANKIARTDSETTKQAIGKWSWR